MQSTDFQGMSMRRLIQVDELGPLHATRKLLQSIWAHSKLEGMFITTWSQDRFPPEPGLIEQSEALQYADPYSPIMMANAAPAALECFQLHPGQRLAIVLRPCELRVFRTLLKRHRLTLSNALLISSDCLAVFPAEDYDWRIGRASDIERLTRDALQFAAQGGILPSRYQRGCQLCERPYPEDVDIHFEVLGVTTSEHLIIAFRESSMAAWLDSEYTKVGIPPSEILTRRTEVLQKLANWRGRSFAYSQSHLDEDMASLEGLVNHLRSCQACRTRLEAHCPLFQSEWLQTRSLRALKTEIDWITNCGGCGMCEHTCPESYPLFTVLAHLKHSFVH